MSNQKQNIHLEQALQAYRLLHTPSRLSWKQHLVNETFSNCDLFVCSPEERQQFYKRLEDCHVTIADNVRTKYCRTTNLIEIIHTLINPARQSIKKIDRSIVYSSDNGERPIGKDAIGAACRL